MVDNIRTIARPDWNIALDALKRTTKLEMSCIQIGTIQAFDTATQLATIKIAMNRISQIGEDGTQQIKEYPLIFQCPVLVLFGGVDFISLPIQAGDSCIVLFNDRDIDYWLNNGDGGVPNTSRLHDLNDAIALVGIRPLTNSIVGYLANGIRLSHGGGNAQADFKDNLIETIATLFLHNGNMQVTGDMDVDEDLNVDGNAVVDGNLSVGGNLTITGDVFGNGGTLDVDANIQQTAGKSIHAGNGATGTFDVVTVVDGIVISGT